MVCWALAQSVNQGRLCASDKLHFNCFAQQYSDTFRGVWACLQHSYCNSYYYCDYCNHSFIWIDYRMYIVGHIIALTGTLLWIKWIKHKQRWHSALVDGTARVRVDWRTFCVEFCPPLCACVAPFFSPTCMLTSSGEFIMPLGLRVSVCVCPVIYWRPVDALPSPYSTVCVLEIQRYKDSGWMDGF